MTSSLLTGLTDGLMVTVLLIWPAAFWVVGNLGTY